jgi:membrane protein
VARLQGYALLDYLDNLRVTVIAAVWGASLASLPRGRRVAVTWLRIAHMLGRELLSGTLTLRAASLVFTTLLSLVPLLAVSFSLLKAFGVHNKLEYTLFQLLGPLGERGAEFAVRIVEFVDQVKVGLLGGVGLLILFLTVISLVQKVEKALNTTWRVHQSRSFVQRFSGYLSVLLVGPLLVFSALGMMGTVMGTDLVQALAAIEPFGTILSLISALLPFLLMVAAFTFVYMFMPNTRVHTSSALVGGAVAGVLWASAGWGFAAFVVNSQSSNYAAIYSSFAIVFFFMLWIYVAWLILLIGGTVAFYHQHPEYLGVMPGELKTSNRLRERIALAAMVRIGAAHYSGRTPPDAVALAEAMRLPIELIEDALEALKTDRLVMLTEEPACGYVPARDMGRIRLLDVLASVRSAHEHRELVPDNLPREPAAESLMLDLEEGAKRVLGERTLRDLVEEEEQPEQSAAGAAPVPLKSAR